MLSLHVNHYTVGKEQELLQNLEKRIVYVTELSKLLLEGCGERRFVRPDTRKVSN